MALKERVERLTQTKAWYGELPVESLYTAGIAGERFFRTLKDNGEFSGTKCKCCGIVYVPGRIFCERCFAPLEEWLTVASYGTLESWTVVYVGLDGSRLAEPIIVGLIRLDGASTVLVHRLGEVTPDTLSIGMKFTAVLKPKTKREGAITDILYFKPV